MTDTFNARMDAYRDAERHQANRGESRKSAWPAFKRRQTEAEAKRAWDRGERKQRQLDALRRAEDNESVTNYPAIYAGFMEKGIPEADIRPRENVFTFNAWKAKGRSVKKGEHGVRVPKHHEANARLIAAAPTMFKTLQSTRLMLYAWKGARRNMGLADDHGELNAAIAEVEAAIKDAAKGE